MALQLQALDLAVLIGGPAYRAALNKGAELYASRTDSALADRAQTGTTQSDRGSPPAAPELSLPRGWMDDTSSTWDGHVARISVASFGQGGAREGSCSSLLAFERQVMQAGVPVILTDAMLDDKEWPARTLWKDASYWRTKIGSRLVPVEVRAHAAHHKHD